MEDENNVDSGDSTVIRKGPGRPRKYSTQEERDVALRKQKQENSRNYYQTHKEKILAQMATKYATKKGNIEQRLVNAKNLLESQGYVVLKTDDKPQEKTHDDMEKICVYSSTSEKSTTENMTFAQA